MRVMHYGDSKSARPACGSGMIGGRSPKQTLDRSRVTCKRCLAEMAKAADTTALSNAIADRLFGKED